MNEAAFAVVALVVALVGLVILVWFLVTLHGIAGNLRELASLAKEQTRLATYSAERLRSIQNLLIEPEED